jgi:Family of unknown function (DUF6516)
MRSSSNARIIMGDDEAALIHLWLKWRAKPSGPRYASFPLTRSIPRIISYMDMKSATDHALEFLLAFDGRIHHHLEDGYWLKFEIKKVKTNKRRPHGLSYSFTLYAPDGTRLIGFDNAHGVAVAGSRYKRLSQATDHWHRTEDDIGRPYEFKDPTTLLDDFFDEVERVLGERGVGMTVVAVEETRRSK